MQEILSEFLDKCKKNMSAKEFKPRFKIILSLMNSLDPAHLNSQDLKQHLFNLEMKIGDAKSTIQLVEDATKEIEKYQRGKKRPLEKENDENESSLAPDTNNKKICPDPDSTINDKLSDNLKPLDSDLQLKKVTSSDTNNSSCDSSLLETKGIGSSEREPQVKKKRIELVTLKTIPTIASQKVSPEEHGVRNDEGESVKYISQVEPEKEKNPVTESQVVVEPEKEKETVPEMEGSAIAPNVKKDQSDGIFIKKASSAKHIKKLEKALERCGKEIKKLEEAEVDWDDEESNYVQCAKYKRRYMQLHKKIAQCRQMSSSLDRLD